MAVQDDVKRMMQVNEEDQQLTRSNLNWVTKSLQVCQGLTPQNISSIYAKQSLSNIGVRPRIGLSSVLCPRQHSVGYMGDGFYRSKDPTNSIKLLKVHIVHKEIKHTIIKQ